MYGRQAIYSSQTEVTADNVLAVLRSALRIHNTNSDDIDYLYSYYRGYQPILDRVKLVRPEINNKIVENHALEIVEFKKGYVFGEPIQYVRRGDGRGVSVEIGRLNEIMNEVDKPALDGELGEWMFIAGTCYRMVLPGDIFAIDMDVCDPRYTFVVYNNNFGRKPIMGCTYVTREDDTVEYGVYTPSMYFQIRGDQIVDQRPHALGAIPIIEYPANNSRLGSFEVVLGLLDALNNSASNRMDGIEQFVQSFMKFVNCDIDTETFDQLRLAGAIKISNSEPGVPADVELVSEELDQSQIQVQIDHMYQMVLTICGMPDRNGANRTTGDTGQAVILRDGWSAAEARARDVELMYKRAEKQFLNLVLRILKDTDGYDLNLKLSDIEIKFSRNKTDNLLTKTQGMQNMLEAGINPQVAITTVGLFSDPEQVFLDSEEFLEKWKSQPANVIPANNKPNPGGESDA